MYVVTGRHDARLRRTLERLREIREHVYDSTRAERDRRRLEDRIREEHHDAQAKAVIVEGASCGDEEVEIRSLKATPAVVGSDNSSTIRHTPLRATVTRMQIRIVRPIPAPLMDGFDVREFRFGHTYDLDHVDRRTANYLLIAGYAVQVEADEDAESHSRR